MGRFSEFLTASANEHFLTICKYPVFSSIKTQLVLQEALIKGQKLFKVITTFQGDYSTNQIINLLKGGLVLESWIAEAVGTMHIKGIKQEEVARVMGVRRDYLNKILNGRNKPANAEIRIMTAISDIIRERENKSNA